MSTTPEILALIHNSYLKQQTEPEKRNSHEWICVRDPDVLHKERVKEQNEWINAAYVGNWEALLKIAMRTNWESYANCTRLRPKPDSESFTWKPSSYTALHHAAWHGAPVEIVQGLIELGSSRGLRTTDGKNQRPLDIAYEKGHHHLYDILMPRGLPEVTDEELFRVQAHFHKIITEEARGVFKPESMQFPDLGLLRDQSRVWMPIPGMYGGFRFWWEDGHLVTESNCRVCGGSGRTNHITVDGAKLVDSGWG